MDKELVKLYADEAHRLMRELCAIPAPSHHEDERAAYCCRYLKAIGYERVYTDEAKNVVCEAFGNDLTDITVFAAHTDTVFPDREPMPYYEKDGIAYCPGVGDDTASLAVLLSAAKYCKDQNISSKRSVLFVCNSCEEGLGNLKGVRALCEKYGAKMGRFITFDSQTSLMVTRCVGSHRYLVRAKTEGGHSFNYFGNKNAIAALAGVIGRIYAIEVPKKEGTKTTYNVGTVKGGTSVNTIAEDAEMLCEYRSDDVSCLNDMQAKFEEIFRDADRDGVTITVEKVGDRPCSRGVDEEKLRALIGACRSIIEGITGETIQFESGSTDCNIPMSLGIPSVAVGVYRGERWHTRDEWMQIESLTDGVQIAVSLIQNYL